MRALHKIWEQLSNDALLKVRMCDLGLDLKHSHIRDYIDQLYAELAQKKIRFRPHIWISTSWFSPYGVPGFALPFYLLHPRLSELERQFIGEVEGGDKDWCMKILRHETGHAIDNAFHLRKSKKRQALFGLSKTKYPTRYLPKHSDKDFVQHLENHYAQAHPDEDWAETFAVWLDPRSNWRLKYNNWGALKKLELAHRLSTKIIDMKQLVSSKERIDDISECKQTLEEYFIEKQRKYRIIPQHKRQKLAALQNQLHNNNDRQGRRWIIM